MAAAAGWPQQQPLCPYSWATAAPSALAGGDQPTAGRRKRPGEQGLLSSAGACIYCTVRGDVARLKPDSIDEPLRKAGMSS